MPLDIVLTAVGGVVVDREGDGHSRARAAAARAARRQVSGTPATVRVARPRLERGQSGRETPSEVVCAQLRAIALAVLFAKGTVRRRVLRDDLDEAVRERLYGTRERSELI